MPLREVFILGRLGYYFVIKIDCRACGEAREGYMGFGEGEDVIIGCRKDRAGFEKSRLLGYIKWWVGGTYEKLGWVGGAVS